MSKTEKTKWFNLLFSVPITILACIVTYITGGFETVADALIFAYFILIIQYAIMIGLWKITKSMIAQRKQFINFKRRQAKYETPQEFLRRLVYHNDLITVGNIL